MEIKIGVQNSHREIVLDTAETSDQLAKAIADGLAKNGIVTFEDIRGRKVIVAAEKLAYVEIGEPATRRVGFGG